MAPEYARFFGGPEGSVPEYDQNDFSEVLKRIFSNGIFASVLNALEVTETDPISLAVSVNTGEGWIEGFWYQNSSALTKSLSAADPDNDRIDRIVLRLDTVTNFKISVEVLEGTPAGSPTAPELTQNANTYEISLAQVLVEAGVTSVTDAKITDERTYAEVNDVKLLEYNTISSSATPTPARASKRNLFTITGLAEAAELQAPSGTPEEGDTLIVRIKDNGTARALTYNAIYRAIGVTLPTTTVISKTLYIGFIYNSIDSKWDCLAVGEEA